MRKELLSDVGLDSTISEHECDKQCAHWQGTGWEWGVKDTRIVKPWKLEPKNRVILLFTQPIWIGALRLDLHTLQVPQCYCSLVEYLDEHKRPWFSVNEVRLLVGYETVSQSVLLGSPEIILTSFSECWHGVPCSDSSSQYQKQWQRRNAMSLQLNFYRAQCRSQCQENHLQDIVWKIIVLSGNWTRKE